MKNSKKPPWEGQDARSAERKEILTTIGSLVERLLALELDESKSAVPVKQGEASRKGDAKSDVVKLKIGDKVVIKVRGEYRGRVGMIDSRCGSFWRVRLFDESNPDWKTSGKLIRKKESSLVLC